MISSAFHSVGYNMKICLQSKQNNEKKCLLVELIMEIVILANWKIHILHKISIVEIAIAGIFCDKTIRPESENASYMYQILCFSELASRCD